MERGRTGRDCRATLGPRPTDSYRLNMVTRRKRRRGCSRLLPLAKFRQSSPLLCWKPAVGSQHALTAPSAHLFRHEKSTRHFCEVLSCLILFSFWMGRLVLNPVIARVWFIMFHLFGKNIKWNPFWKCITVGTSPHIFPWINHIMLATPASVNRKHSLGLLSFLISLPLFLHICKALCKSMLQVHLL